MKLAGLDIGTTACKMTIFTDRGERIDSVSTRYPIVRTQSEHELDAAAVWQAVQSVIEKIAPRHPDLAGIGVTSFGETFVLLDEYDNPLCPAMLYTDPRGQEQCEQLLQKMGDKAIYETAGVSAHSMYSLPKLMWLRDNRADLLTRGRRVLLMADYIVYLLSGRAQIDYSLAARTMAFNVHTGKWSGVPTGLLVLPHFAGAATPYMDTESRGAIVGLTLANTAEDIYLAAMEGICFEMRLNLERLCEAGVAVRQLRATGGGAKNRVWLQMKADILNMPVTLLQTSEAGTTGCAMMTGVALGAFSNLQEAADHMVVEQETVYPRSDVYQRYSTVYERYKGLYKAVRPLV